MKELLHDEDVREEGRAEGMSAGIQREQKLTRPLLGDNRLDDLKRALDDPAFRQKLCEEYTFCKIQLEYDIVHPFGNTMYYHILAIIKEALHNITRHSNANMVSLTLREQPAFIS